MTSTDSLSETARQRGLIALLTDVFCMYTGFFMVIPLISVHYIDDLGWSAAAIGLVLAVRQATQQGLTLFGGVLADKLGAKLLICSGLTVRIIGFLMMAWANTLPLLFLSVILAAVGGALFESPRAAAIAALSLPEERQRFYSLSGVIAGIGMAVGPLIGSWLLSVDFSIAAFVGTACFIANLIQTMIFLPRVRVASESNQLGQGVGLVLSNRPFLAYIVLLSGYWFMWVQLSISLPLVGQTLSSNGVGLIYAINAGFTILLQYPALRFLSKHLPPMRILSIGMVLMSLGLGAIAFATTLPVLVVCVIVFSLGSLLAQPTQQTTTASMANPVALGTFFGFSSLGLAVGGGLGHISGGLLYGWGQEHNFPALPWLVFCTVGIISAAGLIFLQRYQNRTQPIVAADAIPSMEA